LKASSITSQKNNDKLHKDKLHKNTDDKLQDDLILILYRNKYTNKCKSCT